MRVTFLAHSGFFVELPEACLLFDWWKGTLPPIPQDRPLLVFASHRHEDHFSPAIFSLDDGTRDVTFLLGRDIRLTDRNRTRWNVYDTAAEHCIRLGGGEVRDLPSGVKIETLTSTDEGVAFLVTVGGRTLFHAGDLNWWHWEGEPDEYNKNMRRSYQSEINKLCGEKIDAAFVPVDPRLGEQYCLGIDCFMKRTETKRVFPMHFWGNYDVCSRLMLEECTKDYQDKIVKIEREGQTFLCR